MPAIVIDASALAAVVFDEPKAVEVAAQLDTAQRIDAPAFLWYEMASVCVKKIRHHPDDADGLRRALREATELPVSIHPVDPLDAVAVAHETGLSAYDASYLWLARHLGFDLVTLDERLRAVAEAGNG